MSIDTVAFGQPSPILRSFDDEKAREFYCSFLGFRLVWGIASSRDCRSMPKSSAPAYACTYPATMATPVRVRRSSSA